MAADEIYRRQVTLLVRTLPFVAEETCFALKGGTAINLFVRDMPRLSVDIDLTYLPLADRATSPPGWTAPCGGLASASPMAYLAPAYTRAGFATRIRSTNSSFEWRVFR